MTNRLISKVTIGFVIQTFDQSQDRFTSQEFVAGDEVNYEDDNGEPVDSAECEIERGDVMSEPYIGFDMIQPQDNPRISVDNDLQLAICTVVDLANENVYDDGDPEMAEQVNAQNNAVNSVVKMLEECRRQRDTMPTQEIKPTDQLMQAARNALADLEGIMPTHDPSGDRQHPAWTTIEELKQVTDNDDSLSAYQQVISDLATDCEGNEDLLNQALDAMRTEAMMVANG